MPIRERTGPASERERAEVLALQVVRYLLQDETMTEGFMATTGIDADGLRGGVGEPAFLGGVLDYLLGREDLLIAFCEDEGLDPATPARLRHALP